MFWGEPSSTSKIVKITHQQTLGLLLSNCYCPFLNCYCLTSSQTFNYIWSYRTQTYNLTSRHQFIINFKTTHKTMFKISYPIRIKVSIPHFLSNDSLPSPLLFLFNFFLVNPLPTSVFFFTYNPKSWMSSWNLVFLSWSVKIDTKTPSLLSLR
jgi:hypothetical protein